MLRYPINEARRQRRKPTLREPSMRELYLAAFRNLQAKGIIPANEEPLPADESRRRITDRGT